jgi:hypothetical protein
MTVVIFLDCWFAIDLFIVFFLIGAVAASVAIARAAFLQVTGCTFAIARISPSIVCALLFPLTLFRRCEIDLRRDDSTAPLYLLKKKKTKKFNAITTFLKK